MHSKYRFFSERQSAHVSAVIFLFEELHFCLLLFPIQLSWVFDCFFEARVMRRQDLPHTAIHARAKNCALGCTTKSFGVSISTRISLYYIVLQYVPSIMRGPGGRSSRSKHYARARRPKLPQQTLARSRSKHWHATDWRTHQNVCRVNPF